MDTMRRNNSHNQAENNEMNAASKRSFAIQALLIDKKIITTNEISEKIDEIGKRSPADGARVVARAWMDPQFKKRLLKDARSTVKEMGYTLAHDSELVVVENTDKVHHLIVCTLCSCYPRSLLGPPPIWYKSLPYRSRAVSDPRGVMSEWGLKLDDEVEVRVIDSTADIRYMVLPQRPDKTEKMREEQLVSLVTRDSMIGVTRALAPIH